MWSLYKKKESEESIGEGLFNYTGEELEPLVFSNGKSQAGVVKEVMDSMEKGNKIIFIKGVCGSGKSAMALNLARHFDKTSIVVPIKTLQEQYEEDYTKKNFVLKKDSNPLKISVIKGRNNFSCPFAGGACDSDELPCTIELREKNMEKIKEFIDLNPAVEKFDFSTIKDVKRMSVAPACPYWAPLMPSEVNAKGLDDASKIKYKSISGKEFALFQRKKGCAYYDQYESYSTSDVLIFNSMKYLIETDLGRKPRTDLDIIDECDEFLDSFSQERRLNLNRLLSSLNGMMPKEQEEKTAVKEMVKILNDMIYSDLGKGSRDFDDDKIEKIKSTDLWALAQLILEFPYLAEEEERSYYNTAFEILKSFESLFAETYVSFTRLSGEKKQGLFGEVSGDEDRVFVDVVSINLAERFRKIVDSNNVLVLMSGTLHSEQVLKDIFGIENFKVIEAETEMPGKIEKYRTGLEKNCKYANFKNGMITRKQYLKSFDVCMANATPPVLVHVSSFGDLPSEEENLEFKFDNLITQEKLKELQFGDRSNRRVSDFKSKDIDVLFTTKCSRGVDFAGEQCNSIVVTKYPYPNIQGLFWKILRKEQPEKFMEFYMDKARRELLQKVARGVRFKGDKVYLLSPDARVLSERFD